MSGSVSRDTMFWAHATNFSISSTTPNTSRKVSSVLVGLSKPIPRYRPLVICYVFRLLYLLEESSTFGRFSVGSFVEKTEIRVVGDSFRWDLRSKDNNIKRFFFPRVIGSFCQLSERIYNSLPLKKSVNPRPLTFDWRVEKHTLKVSTYGAVA